MATEYGIFNDESPDYTAAEAVEAGFYSVGEAEKALAERYSPEDDLHVHPVEEPEPDPEADEQDEDDGGE